MINRILEIIDVRSGVSLMLTLLIYLCLQFYQLDYRWVDDESWYLMPIPSIWEEGAFRIPTVPGDDVFWPQPPLLIYLEALLGKVTTLDAFSSRLIPLAFSVIMILAVYRLALFGWGPSTALLAAVYVSVDNVLFLTARTVRPDIMIAAFQVVSVLYFYQYIHGAKTKYLFIASGSAALAVASHPNGLMVPLSLGVMGLILVDGWAARFATWLKSGMTFVLLVSPFIAWLLWMDRHDEFQNVISHWTGRHGRFSGAAEGASFFEKNWTLIAAEVRGRYYDFAQWPFRAHIAAVSFVAIIASLVSKDKLIKVIGVIVVAHLMFFIFVNNSNNSVRYLASVLPLVSLIIGRFTGVLLASKKNLGSCVSGFVLFVVVAGSQFAGNALFQWQFRTADYNAVIDELSSEIPDGAVIYGSMSFWLGFNNMYSDTLFVPYMRTNWQQAQERYRPSFVIMDDRVMMGGWQSGEWKPLRESLQRSMEVRGQLIKQVRNKFYGDLKLYAVSYD